MNSFGYSLQVDGKFGQGTENAVKDFQKAKGLTADGVVGTNTWAALKSEPIIDDPPEEDKPEEDNKNNIK